MNIRLFALLISTFLLLFNQSVFSAGEEDDPTPKPTETTQKCDKGQVWDKDKKECIGIQESRFNDDQIFQTARELAYANRYKDAIALLSKATNKSDPRVLNYLGFSYRKAGDFKQSISYYMQALTIDPNYLLARSYMGQGYLAQGKDEQAAIQLAEIRNRGGEDTWSYKALESAMKGHGGY